MASSAIPTQGPGNQTDLTRKCYSTLAISIFLLLVLYIFFYTSPLPRLYRTTAQPLYDLISTSIFFLLALALGAAIIGNFEDNPFVGFTGAPLSASGRRKLLSVITIVLLAIEGLMISISGGAVNSCYSHLLGATSSIALIFSQKVRVRFALLVSTCVIFGVTATRYASWPPFHLTGSPETGGIQTAATAFNVVCFVVAIAFAALAAWRLRP
jgi:hypothetical protein